MLIMNGHIADDGHEESGHPERPDRLTAALAGVRDLHLGDDLRFVEPYQATRAELSRVHEPSYLDELGTFCYEGGGNIDVDTYATYDSWGIAQYAAGAGLAVLDEMRKHDECVGFIAARPPGHHALGDRAMGFCLLNNVAVAAAKLTSDGERVLIVDWDVHHGNGTQSIFWNDPNVLYVSSHQWPLYPGSGGAREVGGLDAVGATVNIPLPARTTGDVLRRGFEELAAPVIDDFAPTWVLVSAGFDAHRDDPLADLALSSGDFANLASVVATYANANRLALFLEGGYNLEALRNSVAATLSPLLGVDYQCEAVTNSAIGIGEIARSASERYVALESAREQKAAEGVSS
jgi:acetoin utilization deacetylase AcuC-like enzyme